MRLVGNGLIVDVQETGIEAVADCDGAPDNGGEHAGGEPIIAVVGELHRLVVAGERGDRGDRSEYFLVKGAHPGFTPVSTVGR